MLPGFVVVEDAVRPETCPRLIEACSEHGLQNAQVGGGNRARDIRDVRLIHLPVDRGIGATMAGVGLAVNRDNWRFDVTHCAQCDFLRYDKEGHYEAHVDTFMQRDDDATRKLSVLLFLSDEHEGGRFFLHEGSRKTYPVQKPGTVVVFPSFMLHGVEPVTSGERFTLITWLVGPWLR